MKKLEAVIPNALLPQVLMLLADDAKELHVHDIPDPPKALPAPAEKAKAERPKAHKTAAAVAVELIREAGGEYPRRALCGIGEKYGFAKDTIVNTADQLVRDGALERVARSDGIIGLKIAPARQTAQPETVQ